MNPKDRSAYLYGLRGRALQRLKKTAQALDDLKEGVRLAPLDKWNNVLLASLLAESGDESGARAVLIEFNKKANQGNLVALARLEYHSAMFQRAVDDYRLAEKSDPKNAELIAGEALALYSNCKFSESQETYSKALKLVPAGPTASEIIYERAFSELANGDYKNAVHDFADVLDRARLDPARVPYAVCVCLVFLRQERSAEASKTLKQASKELKREKWPQPIIDHLVGNISAADLLRKADTIDRQTEARAYIGLDLVHKGNLKSATEQCQWIKENGNRLFLEYPMAMGLLNKERY